MVSSTPIVASSSAALRLSRRPLTHHYHSDAALSVAGQTALVVKCAVALSFSMVAGTAVVTSPPAHSCALSSFAPAALHVLAVVALVAVAAPVRGQRAFHRPEDGGRGWPTVVTVTKRAAVTHRAMLSIAAAAGRVTARRAPVPHGSLFSVDRALRAAVATAGGRSAVMVRVRACRGLPRAFTPAKSTSTGTTTLVTPLPRTAATAIVTTPGAEEVLAFNKPDLGERTDA